MPHSPEPETIEVQTAEAVDPAAICSALDWLTVALTQLENAVCELSPDPNTAALLTCRTALRNSKNILKRVMPPATCPHCYGTGYEEEDHGHYPCREGCKPNAQDDSQSPAKNL
jgi:hypothetical protein